jgi:polysaccharide pyruvyl transferase WcaK-like protein/SAM-dependent methyltransferase
MINILISNAVPLNGGDEALLRALVESLKLRWPQSNITALCKDLDLAQPRLPDLPLAADLEFASDTLLRQTRELYRQADIVVSAPGGFLQDFYPMEDRLRGFEVALALGKPLLLLGQSIGPFWKTESLRRVSQVLNRATSICIREQTSREHLLLAGVNPARIRVTGDAAFLWRRLAPELFRPKDGPIRRVGLSFRAWPLGDTVAVEQTVAKAEQLCRFLLHRLECELVFLSTCQGIPGYVDDSEIGLRILERLPRELQDRCQVDRAHRDPRALMRAFGACQAFIGMRLHGCLLAMLAGTPAMGLGYEPKTQDIFQQLGLESCQIAFNESAETWLACVKSFLAEAPTVRSRLPDLLDQACRRAELNLEAVEQCLSSTGPRPVWAASPPKSEWQDLVGKYGVPHLRLRQVAALVRELAPREILDLGCASGQLHQLCPGVGYVGCDFIAPATPVAFPFYQCDFNHEPLPEDLRELEAIVCSGLLEYIEDLPGFLAQIRSRLKPGGHLIATYFNMNHLSRVGALLRGKPFPVRPDWRGFYSPGEFKNLLAGAGFELNRSVAMNHSLRAARAVEETVNCPLRLPPERWWSRLLAHQILTVARAETASAALAPAGQVAELVPPGCSFILVDETQWADEVFAERRPIPFLEKDGQYWGPPADDETAIRECERLRRAGANFIIFAPPTFWWLKHYVGLDHHLRSHYACVREAAQLIAFDLRRAT